MDSTQTTDKCRCCKNLVPLTDEEIEDNWERITGHSIWGGNRADGRAMYISADEVTEFARAIEAAHGIKGDA